MMQNAMLKTKREGGQIFRLVGLVGSVWQPKLQLCLEGASFSNRHSLCQLLSFWSFSFSLSHFNIFPPISLLFRLTRLPLCASPATPRRRSYGGFFTAGLPEKSQPNMLWTQVCIFARRMKWLSCYQAASMLLFFFLSPLSPQNVLFYPPAFLAESGRRRSLGVMVLLWIQVQNKMEDKARLLSNQRREWFHVWGGGGITDKLTTLTDFSFLRGCNFCVGSFLTFTNVFRCPHRAGNVSQG